MQHLMRVFHKQHGLNVTGDKALQKLRQAAIKAKHELSVKNLTHIDIEDIYAGIDFQTELTRARFEHINEDLFNNTLSSLQQVLSDSRLSIDQIDEVVLTGGSTRIPRIQALVKTFFRGKEANRGINPDEAVAYG